MLTVVLALAPRLVVGAPPSVTPEGFALPEPGHVFHFPADHGSHPEFKIEWWYITGHLWSGSDRRFGFQATFFRQSAPDRAAQLYLAHMALLDVSAQKFISQERLNAAGWDAGAAENTLDVYNGNWSLRLAPAPAGSANPSTGADALSIQLIGGVRGEAAFQLQLTPVQPLVRFGENGVSRKGAAASAASYYLTFPRLRAEGNLTLGTEQIAVHGDAWMDHEISSSQLDPGLVGWDWVGLQFNDGRELMMYRLRRAVGSEDPASVLTWVERDGSTHPQAFSWRVLSTWKSPETGAVYPARIQISTTDPVTSAPVSLTLEPLAPAQELSGRVGGVPYWEGACRVRDQAGREVGSAYLELTGYAHALKL